MSVSEQIEIPVPSSEEHRKDILQKIKEMSNAMTRMESEKEFIKETKKFIKETYDIETKWTNRVLKDYHEDKFDETVREFEEYEGFYESIVNMKNNSGESVAEDEQEFVDSLQSESNE